MNRIVRKGYRFGVGAFYKAYGLDVFGMHKWLMTTMRWPTKRRTEWRLNRIGDILRFAWNEVPFYREYWGDHGIEFRRPRDIEELLVYPVLTKDVFRANAARIQPRCLSEIRHRPWHTGGTTGQPVEYLRDMEQWVLNEAFHLWGWSQTGYLFGDPVGVMAGGSLLPERKTSEARIRGWLHRRLFLYGVAMDRSLALKYHDRLRKSKARILYGYPSVLHLFGRHLVESGRSLPSVKAIITTAEMLLPQYRAGIERSFGCPVFDNLGCNDGGYEAYECSLHTGFHYNDLQSILEVNSADSNGMGRLIITNLWNRSTPFIRYENGDLVRLARSPCPCGCPFPIISSIEGRTADILTFGNGRALAGPALTLIFGEMEIDGWQVVQTGSNRLEVRISCSHELKPEYATHAVTVLRRHLGDDVEIVVKRVSEMDNTKGGKRKPIWREVASEQHAS